MRAYRHSAAIRPDLLALGAGLGILLLTPINTDISIGHMLLMGAELLLALILPRLILRALREPGLRFRWRLASGWTVKHTAYIALTVLISYFLLPFYLRSTGAYLNWRVAPGTWNLIRLFIGTNALGIWDELFFVNTALPLLRRHLPFVAANALQAVLFTAFLYELGFTGWGPLMIFPFAVLQGLAFRATESLLYVIAIHLSLDLVLYLALIQAHHPDWLRLFVT